MGRGRPASAEYLRIRDAFIETALQRMDLMKMSQTALAHRSLVRRGQELVSVNRGTVSRIFSRKRVAPLDVLQALMRTLGFEPELMAEFTWACRTSWHATAPTLISDYNYPRPPLLAAVTLLVRGFYASAYGELRRIFDAAGDSGDGVLQADAAARIAWLLLEMGGDFASAAEWARTSIDKCTEYGIPAAEIICSAARCALKMAYPEMQLRHEF